jgi:hypothetical protein
MADHSPSSVTLKINRTSVMLYASRYVKLPDGSGATGQRYLGSFPVSATEVPAKFEALLREATAGRPERYTALMRRIETQVLSPARRKKAQEDARRHRAALATGLHWATGGLRSLDAMVGFAEYIGEPELQGALQDLLNESTRLSAHLSNPRPVASEPPVPQESPEQRLQRKLAAVGEGCSAIVALMPESVAAFPRGFAFHPDTVAAVRRLWFMTSDAVAALSARSQFHRPAKWAHLRDEVLGPSTAPPKPDSD